MPTRRRYRGGLLRLGEMSEDYAQPLHRGCNLQNFAECLVPIDGAEQSVFKRVNGQDEISKCVRLVNQHRHATRRQTFPNAHRPWQANRDVAAPAIAGKRDRRHRGRR